MGHELSYDNTSFHTQDYLKMQEFIREFGDSDVLETLILKQLG